MPHNRFLVTALQTMGLSPGDDEMHGNRGYDSTGITASDGTLFPIDSDLTRAGESLPEIRGET